MPSEKIQPGFVENNEKQTAFTTPASEASVLFALIQSCISGNFWDIAALRELYEREQRHQTYDNDLFLDVLTVLTQSPHVASDVFKATVAYQTNSASRPMFRTDASL